MRCLILGGCLGHAGGRGHAGLAIFEANLSISGFLCVRDSEWIWRSHPPLQGVASSVWQQEDRPWIADP
jgi:hypothetical protein